MSSGTAAGPSAVPEALLCFCVSPLRLALLRETSHLLTDEGCLSWGQAPLLSLLRDFSSQSLYPGLVLPGFPVPPSQSRSFPRLPEPSASLPQVPTAPSRLPALRSSPCLPGSRLGWTLCGRFMVRRGRFLPHALLEMLPAVGCSWYKLVSALLVSLPFPPGTSAPISLSKPVTVALPIAGGSQADASARDAARLGRAHRALGLQGRSRALRAGTGSTRRRAGLPGSAEEEEEEEVGSSSRTPWLA